MYLFEFNGIKSNEVGQGYAIMNFNGFNNDGVTSAGNDITFATSKPANGYKQNFHGSSYNEVLTFTFQIGKALCGGSYEDYVISQAECAYLLRWLVRSDGYKYLRFFKDEYEKTYFNCQLKLSWIKFKDSIVGAQLDVTCDAPFGYSDLHTFEVSCSNGTSFVIFDDSDKVGQQFFDQIDIVMTSNASNLQIVNSLDALYSPFIKYNTSIKNCVNNEHISISGEMISTSNSAAHTRGNINNDYNFKHPRLINLSDFNETRRNVYTVTGGSCKISFAYRTIRSVIV